jgi:hypothetical protein
MVLGDEIGSTTEALVGSTLSRPDDARPACAATRLRRPGQLVLADHGAERSSAECVGGGIAELIGSAIPATSSILVTSPGRSTLGKPIARRCLACPPISGPGSRLIMSSAVW